MSKDGGKRVASHGVDPDYKGGGAPKGINVETGQHDSYWVLSDEEIAKLFVRPIRRTYKHTKCGVVTTMSVPIAETYARDPKFYGATFCCGCKDHYSVGEFTWVKEDGSDSDEVVGS